MQLCLDSGKTVLVVFTMVGEKHFYILRILVFILLLGVLAVYMTCHLKIVSVLSFFSHSKSKNILIRLQNLQIESDRRGLVDC